MGLDMDFFSVRKGSNDTSCENPSYNHIQYFRKHSDLNGWLQDKWLETQPEGTDPGDFDCTDFQITQEILDEMKKLCDDKYRKHYQGFFWGESSDDQWELTKQLCDTI